MSGLLLRIVLPWLARVALPANLRFSAAVERTNQSIAAMLAYRRQSDENHDDILALLLNAEPHAPETFSDNWVRDEIFGFMFAGYETTAVLTTWTLHLLATHSHDYHRVVGEIDAALDGELPTYADLPRLPYLHRCLHEALRLYPPVWLLSRTICRPVVLGGYHLPENADVFFSISAMHRDPDIFPDPDLFDPDRWLNDRAGQPQRDALLAFGAGARKCIGKDFGIIEAATMLTVLLQRWEISAKPGYKVKPQIGMGTHPVGVQLVVQRRSRATHGARRADETVRDNTPI
jgi:cytochrome P450